MEVDRELTDKTHHLLQCLQGYGRVAVAFSGGVDSTLLLQLACKTLGRENVVALHVHSCLVADADHLRAEQLVTGPGGIGCPYQTITLFPLRWRKFTANTEERCYICKFRMYSSLFSHLAQHPPARSLLDGTNFDDLHSQRPGLKAIAELAVGTPLADAGITKNEIRHLARLNNLANWDLNPNSCLATRIPIYHPIHRHLLQQISRAEVFLQQKNLTGCRVKPFSDEILILVQRQNLHTAQSISDKIHLYFQSIGLTGRPVTIRAFN